MVPHESENPAFTYTLANEIKNLRDTRDHRGIPRKHADRLLVATWNLTNFGVQERTDDDLALMAEIISWFDLVAIQEIADDLSDMRRLMTHLSNSYDVVVSDVGGNEERAGFLYNSRKVKRLELAAEVAVPPSDHRHIRVKEVSGEFHGFDRNPYVVAFKAKDMEFLAVSAHLFFGSSSYRDEDRRALEAYALSRWADQRLNSAGVYSKNVLVMGDLNLPIRDEKSPVYRALKAKRLILPPHSTAMGSNLAGDKEYDQVGFHAGELGQVFVQAGVFDFDRAPFFKAAWDTSEDYFVVPEKVDR